MQKEKQKVVETAAFLSERIDQRPILGLLTGTGLGESAEAIDSAVIFEYQDLPHFPLSTVQTHRGRLHIGEMQGHPVMALQGRFHLYEGYSPLQITFPIRVMQALGVKTLILSNASGGLNPRFNPGDIMMITDHINLTGANPLIGPNEDTWGDRFPDMSRAYDPELMQSARSAARFSGHKLPQGVYVGLKGPSLETPAEVRFLQTIGADAVGFSTVLEVIAAVHAGMHVIGFSIITNVHDPDHPVPANVDQIISIAENTAPKLDSIILKVIEDLPF